MKVTKEICSFDELWEQSWGGAKDTLKTIMDNDSENELMDYLEETFYNEPVNETTLNDFLWFEADNIYIEIGIEDE